MTTIPLLSIDLWHTHLTTAIRTADGRSTPLMIDECLRTPTGVAVCHDGALHAGRIGAQLGRRHPESYIRVPGPTLLDEHVSVNGVRIDPVDVMAAVLVQVTTAARHSVGTVPDEVVVAVPARWTARQRQRLRVAAVTAGLGQPEIVAGAESILREQGAEGRNLPTEMVAVVCRLADTVGEVVLLQRESQTYQVLAAYDLGEVGEIAGTTITDQAATAIAAGIDSCGVSVDQIAMVLCDGSSSQVRALAAALPTSTGVAVVPRQVDAAAAACGGIRSHQLRQTDDSAGRRDRELVRATASIALAWASVAALVLQLFESRAVIGADTVGPTGLLTRWYSSGLGLVLAIVGNVCLCLLTTPSRTTRPDGTHRRDAVRRGALMLVAAALGLATGLAATYGEPLHSIVVAAVPAAVIVAVLVLLAFQLLPPPGSADHVGWRRHLRPPMTAALFGGLAIVALVGENQRAHSFLADGLDDLAGYGLAWAIALHLTAAPWHRLTIGLALAAAATFSAIASTTDATIAACLVLAIVVWWFVRSLPTPALIVRTRRRLAAGDS
jgi:hypothetical protein